MNLLRHIVAILALPFVVLVVVPVWLVNSTRSIDTRWPFGWPLYALPFAAGLLFLAIGLWLLVTTVHLFATVGQGTLAPWDPPRKLVVVGPYRYTRNPMITSVVMILLGMSLLLGSLVIAAWTLIAFAVNTIYFVAVEEPSLLLRFGDEYSEYQRHVPRWFPRRAPWKVPDTEGR